jgi:hypothetical protein
VEKAYVCSGDENVRDCAAICAIVMGEEKG